MKQEKVRTRKQTALRRLGQLFTVVVIVALYSGANLSPRQAAGDIAEHLDMEENKEFIECVYDPSLPETKTTLRYLVDNGQAMMLCTVKWDLFMGWYDWDWCKVEAWEDAPLHAGLLSHNKNGERYLLTSVTDALPMDPYDTVRYQEIHLLGYDRSGAVIADEEVYWQSWG